MKILIDTLDLEEIRKYSAMGILSGVTTNPTFSKRFGMKDDIDTVIRVADAMDGKGEIHVEAWGEEPSEIIKDANRIQKNSKYSNLVFKVPFTRAGIEASNSILKDGHKVNLHLIYSTNQALLAQSIGSSYICPLVGRLDDVGHDGPENIRHIRQCLDSCQSNTLIMASSIRNPKHVTECCKAGADVITVPPKILSQMVYHPMTDLGFETFKKDLESMQ